MSEKNTTSSRSRSWFVVCPNIIENGVASISSEAIKDMTYQAICDSFVAEQMEKFPKGSVACIYCKSEKGMEHLHIVLCNSNALSFSSIKKFLGPKAHIEPTKGTKDQVEAYINKKPPFDEKGEVILCSSQRGELIGKQGKRNDLEYIQESIRSGMTQMEVRRLDPNFFSNRYTEIIRNMFIDHRIQTTPVYNPDMKVEWHMGLSGSGKTFYFVSKGSDKCYIVHNYRWPFDRYCAQDIICFNEFKGQFKYSELLNYTDKYRISDLDSRHVDNISCQSTVAFTSVYIPDALYQKMVSQSDQKQDTLSQFIRRITDYYWHFYIDRSDGKRDYFLYHFTPVEYGQIKDESFLKTPEDITDHIKAHALAQYMQSENYTSGDDMSSLM